MKGESSFHTKTPTGVLPTHPQALHAWPMANGSNGHLGIPAASLALESGEGLAARKSFPAQRFNLRCAEPLRSVGGPRHRRPGKPKMVRNATKNKIVCFRILFRLSGLVAGEQIQGSHGYHEARSTVSPRGSGASAHTAAAQPALVRTLVLQNLGHLSLWGVGDFKQRSLEDVTEIALSSGRKPMATGVQVRLR